MKTTIKDNEPCFVITKDIHGHLHYRLPNRTPEHIKQDIAHIVNAYSFLINRDSAMTFRRLAQKMEHNYNNDRVYYGAEVLRLAKTWT